MSSEPPPLATRAVLWLFAVVAGALLVATLGIEALPGASAAVSVAGAARAAVGDERHGWSPPVNAGGAVLFLRRDAARLTRRSTGRGGGDPDGTRATFHDAGARLRTRAHGAVRLRAPPGTPRR